MKRITFNFSSDVMETADALAASLKITTPELITFCLEGSTNLGRDFLCAEGSTNPAAEGRRAK
jgi:hypothetical protein